MTHRRAGALAILVAVLSVSACHREPENAYLINTFALQLTSRVDSVSGATVSLEFESLAAPRMLLGRFFVPGDYKAAALPVAVLNYDLWARRFGSETRIIGGQIRVNGRNVTVVGVTARGFEIPRGAQLWVPGQK